MHTLSNKERERRIEDYFARETAGIRKQVEYVEAVVQQEHNGTGKAENARLTN